jgi:histidine triad (HIT) family protein
VPTLFSRIVKGEIPCHFIAEDDRFFAFLDIQPLTMGHVLVVPKIEADYVFDLDIDTYTGLFEFARLVAPAIEAVVSCKRIGLAIVGLEVPHVHIHLIPMNQGSDMDFSKRKLNPSSDELAGTAQQIRAHFLRATAS